MCCIDWGTLGLWVGAIATAIYAGFTIGLYLKTRIMANAAIKSAENAQETFISSQRPWIEIRPVTLNRNAHNQIVLYVNLYNHGNSPARVSKFTIAEITNPNPYTEQINTTQFELTIMPKSEARREFVFDDRRLSNISVQVNVAYTSFGRAYKSSLKYRFTSGAPEELESSYE